MLTTVMVLRHSREFVSRYCSHPVDLVHLQCQQDNDALINALTRAL